MVLKQENDKLRHHLFFNVLVDIVRQSGSKIMEYYKSQKPNVMYKSDKTPVTEADIASHKIISSELSAISDLPIISEESLDHYTDLNCYWLIDPLDGTKEFISQNDQFTVNVALIENKFPTLGIVYLPVEGTAYIGGKGMGSLKVNNSNKCSSINVSKVQSPIRVIASKNHLNEETRAFIRSLGNVEIIQSGSSLKFCLISEGRADIYPRLAPTSEWDTAAAQAVVEGAGGTVKTINGSRLHYQKSNIINPYFIVRGDNNLSS